jgi:hypothetical protein
MIIAFFILTTLLIAAYSFAPLMHPRERWLNVVEHGATRQALEAEKESYLRAIKDIEFEHASNKINDQDYAELRKHYAAKAAKVIHDLEQLPEEELSPAPEPDIAPAAKKPQKNKNDIESQIAVIKEKISVLENDWEIGEINDDHYFIQYDEYTKELSRLVRERKELLLEDLDKVQQKDG